LREIQQAAERLAIAILHNFADELYSSEPDGCPRFSSRIHANLRMALSKKIARVRRQWRRYPVVQLI
jgi:hypothetical protein